MNRLIMDMHTHSSFSPDAADSAELMYKRASEIGLSYYALTDHCDCNFWYPVEHYKRDNIPQDDMMMYGSGKYSIDSIAEQKRLKEHLKSKLNGVKIIIGIELGQPLQDIENAETIASDKNLDFIIGSHHQNRGENDFYYLKYDSMTKAEIYKLLDDYFEQMLEMCKWGKFDVLGHLTYPLRYICGEYGIDIDLSSYYEIIREIFKTIINNGKGIEINTSGLRQKYGKTFPDEKYVRLYKELGGEIITVGSDAHCVKDLGKGISEGIELAETAGFKYLACFEKHKPEFIKI